MAQPGQVYFTGCVVHIAHMGVVEEDASACAGTGA